MKQTIHISKEDMEDYNVVMFTHAMDFLKEHASLKKPIPKLFFYKPLEWLVNKGFGNTWQLTFNIVHEALKAIVYNSRTVIPGATWTKEQNVKILDESPDDRVGPKTTRCVRQLKKKTCQQMIKQPKSNCFHYIVVQKTW